MSIQKVVGDGIPIPESEASFQEFLKDEKFIHYVAMTTRPGVNECITLLEHRDFPPRTERNEFFQMHLITWEGLSWYVVSIPIAEKHLMEQAAAETGLRVSDGVPRMISKDGMVSFPADNERVFTLENQPGHPVYRNDLATHRKLLEGERQAVARMQRHASKKKR